MKTPNANELAQSFSCRARRAPSIRGYVAPMARERRGRMPRWVRRTFLLSEKCLERFQTTGLDPSDARPAHKLRATFMNVPTAFPDQSKPVPPYKHTPLFPLGPDATPYKKISSDGARVEKVLGKEMLVVSREALRALSEAAFGEINHYLRPGHLQQLRSILDDKEASDNDKFVALDFLKNANI